MGMPARKLEFEEITVEDRLGKLESTVAHIQSDVTEMKGDIRRLDAKIDARFDEVNRKVDALKDSIAGKFDAGNASTAAKFDAVNAKFDAVIASIAAQTVSIEKAFSKLVVWAFTLYIALAAGLLTVMGHGFHWF